jgi:hypothetical protein
LSANDAIQKVSEALASIIESNAAVQALTARMADNIARYRRRKKANMPSIAYLCTDARPRGGTGDNWDVDVVLQTEAAKPADANALLGAAVQALTVQAFTAASVDAVILAPPELSNLPDDGADPSTNTAAVIAEAAFTVWITL